MRQTFGELQNTSQDYISQNTGSFTTSTVVNFIKEHINKRYQLILSVLRNYQTQPTPRTATTTAGNQYYSYPPGTQSVQSATLTIANVAYPLIVVNSQMDWNYLNQIDFSGTTIPQYIFPRQRDFGIYPIPQTTGDTITLVPNLQAAEMTADDYAIGTITLTTDNIEIVGVGTTFTADMAGRWFKATGGDNFWYRIGSFTDTTHLNLETYYEGESKTSVAYIIGESPEIPEELHEIIPHGVAADFYSGPRKDFTSAQAHNNYFWTGDFSNASRRIQEAQGGLLGAQARYATRANSNIIYRKKARIARFDERFSTTLTASP